jgi:ABC-type polysaccharide/polyol phosphate transport system ATPase subunit
VSLSVFEGETVALLGRNGAGKTTLLRILEGSLVPDHGSCFTAVKPESMNSLTSGFQGYSSVLNNTISLGRLRGVRPGEVRDFANEVIAFAGLDDKANHLYRSLSTGMKSRLGFSFAHIFDPKILLIDEGFANGDRWFRDKAQKVISRYLASGKTVIMTSHSEKILRESCTRGVVLSGGTVLFDGPIAEAFEIYHSDG